MTILLVDDNPVVLFQLSHVLKSAGFRVLEAATGAEALRLARTETPALALLDVQLPDLHGFELCRRLKADPATQHTFVVLFSDKETSSESQASGLDAGADGYISRPIGNRELVARLQAMARIQQAEAGLRTARDELGLRVTERTEELSRANAELRELSQRLVDVQEAERRAVAHELHDEIGQWLTGLKLFLETSLKPGARVADQVFAEALGMIDETMERVRQLSVSLRPQMLDDLGLLPALGWHFQRFGKQTGIQVQFKHTPLAGRLPARLETAAFRIVQEALTNAARHSGVKEVAVRLWTDEQQLGLQIEDHGAGFDPGQALAARSSSGLAGMRERAELLGGELTVESSHGAGTRLTVALPLNGHAVHQTDDARSPKIQL